MAALDSRVGWEGQESVAGSTWKKLWFSPYITHCSLTVFEKDIFSADGSVLTDRRARLRAAGEMCLTFKKKDAS